MGNDKHPKWAKPAIIVGFAGLALVIGLYVYPQPRVSITNAGIGAIYTSPPGFMGADQYKVALKIETPDQITLDSKDTVIVEAKVSIGEIAYAERDPHSGQTVDPDVRDEIASSLTRLLESGAYKFTLLVAGATVAPDGPIAAKAGLLKWSVRVRGAGRYKGFISPTLDSAARRDDESFYRIEPDYYAEVTLAAEDDLVTAKDFVQPVLGALFGGVTLVGAIGWFKNRKSAKDVKPDPGPAAT